MKVQSNKKSFFSDFTVSVEKFIKEHKVLLIAFAVFFSAVSVLNFADTSTSETVESFRLEDFEEGAIADRNIYARTTLEPDISNPVSVQEGERIIHKGFKITAEEYSKLKKLAEAPSYIDYRAFADTELFLLLVFTFYFFLFTPVLLKRENTYLFFYIYATCSYTFFVLCLSHCNLIRSNFRSLFFDCFSNDYIRRCKVSDCTELVHACIRNCSFSDCKKD